MADDQSVDHGADSRWLQRILLAVTLIGAAAGIRNLPIGGDGAEDSTVADWPDSNRQILIANVIDMPFVVMLIPRDQVDQARKDHPDAEIALQEGTPYAMMRVTLLSSCRPPMQQTALGYDRGGRPIER